MYRPFNNHCRCGSSMHPIDDVFPDNTQPDSRDKEATVTFWCTNCKHAEHYTYKLPILYDDVSKNVIQWITKLDPMLGVDITLNTSNFGPIEQKGLMWALADLQQKNLIYDLEGSSFKLTLLGQLLVWHGPYY